MKNPDVITAELNISPRKSITSDNRPLTVRVVDVTTGPRQASLEKMKRSRSENTRPYVVIDGRKVVKQKDPIMVTQMQGQLVQRGYALPSEPTSIKEVSLLTLGGVNITVKENIGRNYSLLDDMNNQELLENTNIVDPKFKDLKNSLTNPSVDKFVDKSSPFYNLDEGPSTMKKNQNRKLKENTRINVTKIAADVMRQNISQISIGPNLPQFTKYT